MSSNRIKGKKRKLNFLTSFNNKIIRLSSYCQQDRLCPGLKKKKKQFTVSIDTREISFRANPDGTPCIQLRFRALSVRTRGV